FFENGGISMSVYLGRRVWSYVGGMLLAIGAFAILFAFAHVGIAAKGAFANNGNAEEADDPFGGPFDDPFGNPSDEAAPPNTSQTMPVKPNAPQDRIPPEVKARFAKQIVR